jgi:hypothetical protein
MAWSASAASTTRQKTTVRGGNSPTAILEKKNDPPHSTASNSSRPHSTGPMIRLAAVVELTIACRLVRVVLPRRAYGRSRGSGMPDRALELG